MNQDTVVSLATQAMTIALKVAGPMLLAGLIIGLLVSIFQAVTQIQEQSLTFIPKVVGVAALIVRARARGCSISSSATPRTCTRRSRR